ncbi:hypothetical protein EPK99_15330 [Neorhizobium lilium]|uniref:Flagellar FliJ protein n=1 Tax=Neorhizobium lilium TaxID=2503024 RepID=A0A444LFR9_9HYPH|nr:hypothetical protein [Neorhizobium lilium]RWX77032.1 hypothetical protein EPK99_15330 [Neorhizobium lilium]
MANDSKSEKLRRLVDVQRQLEKLAEFELSVAISRQAEVTTSIVSTINAISSVDSLHQQFAKNYSERLTRLFTRSQQLAIQQNIQEAKVLREKTKGDRLEDKMKDAEVAEERLKEDERMYDLVDLGLLAATPVSSKLDDT